MSSEKSTRTVPSEESFYQLLAEFNLIPVVRTLDSLPDPFRLYEILRTEDKGFVLESGKGGRYSYVGCGEAMRFLFRRDGTYEISVGEAKISGQGRDPFELLRDFFGRYRLYSHPSLNNFSGGGIGLFSYDLARFVEKIPEETEDDLKLPVIDLIVPTFFVELDHEKNKTHLIALSDSNAYDAESFQTLCAQLDSVEKALEVALESASYPEPSINEGEPLGTSPDEANLTSDEFERLVSKAIDYIYAGDLFQVNLSVRFSRRFSSDPITLYRALRQINPAPYMAFLDFKSYAVVSSSPELLLKVEGRELSTRPIAGTRKRGGSDKEDMAKINELIGNEKERAEHLMLVDLERNDLGRVSEYGSVHVDEFMSVEKYSHVIHIVSNVRGKLGRGKDTFDAIRAVFPGGTITGAPKARAMEIIEELEPHSRGLYTGSIGWVGFNGDTELNIAIRTLLVKDGTAYAQAGSGIVADSVPEYEYKESIRKAEAMLKALRETEPV